MVLLCNTKLCKQSPERGPKVQFSNIKIKLFSQSGDMQRLSRSFDGIQVHLVITEDKSFRCLWKSGTKLIFIYRNFYHPKCTRWLRNGYSSKKIRKLILFPSTFLAISSGSELPKTVMSMLKSPPSKQKKTSYLSNWVNHSQKMFLFWS